MLPDFALLGGDAIAKRGIALPEGFQCLAEQIGRSIYLNFRLPCSELAQSSRDVKCDTHDERLLRRVVVFRVLREEGAVAFCCGDGLRKSEESPMAALLMQTIDGSPSRIFFHDLPSSVEP